MPPSPLTRVIRFGAFEVEPQAGILRKGETRIRLQEQPFQVLLALLERPGEVVTREELHQKVWKGEPFGDIDHRINIAVNKIREALRDSAETPRFVETLPRKGYRFIAQVEGPPEAKPDPPAPVPDRPSVKRRWWIWAAGAVPVLAVAVWLLMPWREKEAPLIPVPLTTYPGTEDGPDFSPDGNQVAFLWDGDKQTNFDIYVKVIGSDPPSRLTRDPAVDWSPAWSPDGRQIAFMSDRTGAPEIWIANKDGSGARQLTFGSIFSGTPRWSPDGRWIAFDSQAENGRWDIYVVDSAGGQPRRVTQQEGINAIPSWSRDGKWIYFSSDRSGRNEIMRIPAGGGEATQITSKGGGAAFESSDGASIYYTKGDPDTGLWRMPVGGGAEQKILESVFMRSFHVVEDGIYATFSRS